MLHSHLQFWQLYSCGRRRGFISIGLLLGPWAFLGCFHPWRSVSDLLMGFTPYTHSSPSSEFLITFHTFALLSQPRAFLINCPSPVWTAVLHSVWCPLLVAASTWRRIWFLGRALSPRYTINAIQAMASSDGVFNVCWRRCSWTRPEFLKIEGYSCVV